MTKDTRFVGFDVDADSISVAVAEPGRDGEVRFLGEIPKTKEALRKLIKKVGPAEQLRVCYEAGPTGYGLYWDLTKLGVKCEVVAPGLVPVRPGDRVKTNRRDALKLARSYRSGDLTPVWVPDHAHEALRDLVRAREAAKKDQQRIRNRLQKFLLRQSHRPPVKLRAWTRDHLRWIEAIEWQYEAHRMTLLDYLSEVKHQTDRLERLERAIDDAVEAAPESMRAVITALQAMRGVKSITAATIVTELGQLSRFPSPRQLMAYSGAVPSEYSSGARTQRGAITKTGNAHLRRVIIEAAWNYRHLPRLGAVLKKRQRDVSENVKAIAWKAQHRLYRRYHRLTLAGKPHQKAVVAVARELLGFIWAIGVETERARA
jgi:transposase